MHEFFAKAKEIRSYLACGSAERVIKLLDKLLKERGIYDL
jgi:lipid-A-disaccharide synthase